MVVVLGGSDTQTTGGPVLSPWPTKTGDLETARTFLREALRDPLPAGYVANDPSTPQPRISENRLDQFGQTASALVERYAPDAPRAVKNEATIRTAAYIHQREPKPVQGISIGETRIDLRERFQSPDVLRNSGALNLLKPWRRRRALPIEETD